MTLVGRGAAVADDAEVPQNLGLVLWKGFTFLCKVLPFQLQQLNQNQRTGHEICNNSIKNKFYATQEGTARYAGLLLARVEGFGQGVLVLGARAVPCAPKIWKISSVILPVSARFSPVFICKIEPV